MFYEFDITVQTSHTLSNPYTETFHLSHGVIHQISINFPSGCAGAVHAVLSKGLNQIFPCNPSGSVKGDGINVKGDTFIGLFEEPYEVNVKAWSMGTSYNHILTIRFWVKRVWQLMPFSDQMYSLALEQDTSRGI